MRKLVAILVGAAVLLLTPYFLYKQLDPEFDYGAAELRAAVEGTWQAQLARRDGEPSHTITFTIRQATAVRQQHSQRGVVRSAAACSHRTLIRSAEACLDVTDMALHVKPLEGNVTELAGRFLVVGTAFRSGSLELTIDGRHVTADVSPAGDVLSHNDGVLALSRIAKPPATMQPR